ncbi:tripartite tricarboxylate transporter substrate binding protein [Ramlibacter sp. USB13]|uniref:Tripartite tricarboxylate transporter substrate binding protein n=1 Tax=Ramlibacter cellulosilyticus TaxID=2764187 RepID=A0A923MTQ3_9BURK|nr:tripartite tricarboxylate transporter substrate binding protein [Ramlibacter cellulosilyticus]MBC5784816.1 tripartite tricarboxylate transporter substrate binding protein [Ramlibacter cellulosilyticus]
MQAPSRRLTRRALLGATAGALALPAFAFAQASSYPARPISLIVPWPAGGQTDITMRILAELAGRTLGQPVVVENRPGAAGTLVGPALHNAAPDGYVLGQLPLTLYRAALQRKVPWDPLRDITPVIQISGVTFGIVVPADSAFRSFADLVAWGRENPGRLTVGSTGIGSTAHLAMEDVLSREGVRYIHVPYKGTADQMLAVATKTLMVGVNSTGFAPYVETGKLRLLANFNAQRSKRWPHVPTMRELGYPEAVYTSPYGIGMPAGGDPLVVRKLHDAFRQALFDPMHLQELAKYDMEPEYLDTATYGRYVQEVSARERQLLARLGLGVRTE